MTTVRALDAAALLNFPLARQALTDYAHMSAHFDPVPPHALMGNLNRGLTLRRPIESPYAAARRYLLCNRAIPTPTLLRHLRLSLTGATAYIATTWLAGQPWLSCSNEGYPVHSLAQRRNCPRCAQQCFHSPLFALPWLGRCPLHGDPLTTTCPVCSQPWPHLHLMATSRCLGCGGRADLADLLANRSTRPDPPYNLLIVLSRLLHDLPDPAPILLTSTSGGSARSCALDKHSAFTPFLLASAFPDARPLLRALALDFTGVAIETSPWDHRKAESIYSSLRPTDCAVPIQSALIQTFSQVLSKDRQPASPMHWYSDLTNSAPDAFCPSCMAFSIYFDCVRELDDNRQSHQLDCRLLPPLHRSFPVPRPVSMVACERPDEGPLCLQLPLRIAQRLYLLKCWALFHTCYRYCQWLYPRWQAGQRWPDLADCVPVDARVWRVIEPAFGLQLGNKALRCLYREQDCEFPIATPVPHHHHEKRYARYQHVQVVTGALISRYFARTWRTYSH